MSDIYKVSARIVGKRGGVFGIRVREKDSEVIPEEEKTLMLLRFADKCNVKLRPPVTIELAHEDD